MKVGFIGTGRMGGAMAGRITAAGFETILWNRDPLKAERVAEACGGAAVATSVAEAASKADVVLSSLADDAALEAAYLGAAGVLEGIAAGAVAVDTSTVDPRTIEAVGAAVDAKGAGFLDCPVSGSPATLAAGQMSVMVGGDRAAFDHVEGVLHAIGPKVTYIGENGHAILTKVAINLALVVSVTAFAEGVALVEKAGVSRAAVVDAALKSVIASPVIGYRAPLLVDDTAVFADVDLQQKDLVLAEELARGLGMAVPTCAATSEMLSAARSSERADRDFVVSVHEAYRRIGGMQ